MSSGATKTGRAFAELLIDCEEDRTIRAKDFSRSLLTYLLCDRRENLALFRSPVRDGAWKQRAEPSPHVAHSSRMKPRLWALSD